MNLAVEERLLRAMEERRGETAAARAAREAATGVHVLTYVNDPAVVVGRFQNEFQECWVRELRASGEAQLVRRRSGGGTVYHDRGCVCFSLVTPRALYDPARSIDVVRRALGALGVPGARAGPRHDLWLGERKITGSAFRVVKDAAYHHGTLLVETDLALLSRLIHPPRRLEELMECKSVASVRSPVVNILEAHPEAEALRGLRCGEGWAALDRISHAIAEAAAAEYGMDGVGAEEVVEASLPDADHEEAAALRGLVASGAPALVFSLPSAQDLGGAVRLRCRRGEVLGVAEVRLPDGAPASPEAETAFDAALRGAAMTADGLCAAAKAVPTGALEPHEAEFAEAVVAQLPRALHDIGF